MLHHTRGIVLHHFRYSETSIIARIYTEKFGLQSYLIKGIRNSRSRIRIGLFEHLTLLNLVVYRKENRELQNIREVQLIQPLSSVHTDIRKSSQALFINEVIVKSVKEEECNPALFDFLFRKVLALDAPGDFSPHFHLSFMVELTVFLGFAPRMNFNPGYFFNLKEGIFEPGQPLHLHFLEPSYANILYLFMLESTSATTAINIPSNDRRYMLERLLEYYKLHMPSFSGLRSPEILHEVLRD